MASAAAPRRVDGASTAQPGRRAAAAQGYEAKWCRAARPPVASAPSEGASRFQTLAVTSASLRCSRRKAPGRGQGKRNDRSFQARHGARIHACACPHFKKVRPRPPRGVFFAAALRDCRCRPPHARLAWRMAGHDPPFTSPSPPFTQCYRRGPFWPASGATVRARVQVRAPPATAPWQPHHNARDPL